MELRLMTVPVIEGDVAVRVGELWRYPVKSLQGERLDRLDLDTDGVVGDRSWALRDVATGKVLTARREPRLLLAASRLMDDSEPVVELPDGTTVLGTGPDTDAALSDWVGRPVELVAADDARPAVAEAFDDATDDSSAVHEWTMPAGRFVDAMPLLVVTTASLRAASALHPTNDWAVRRFRPNVVVDVPGDGWVEDDWCGETVLVGAAAVAPQRRCMRCTMVTRPQPGIDEDREVFRALARAHGGYLGVLSAVVTTGQVSVGDGVAIIPRQRSAAPARSTADAPAR